MQMKEDAMKNGQLKPAYNIQFGVDSEYVIWITAGPQATDTTTLIPFLESLKQERTLGDAVMLLEGMVDEVG